MTDLVELSRMLEQISEESRKRDDEAYAQALAGVETAKAQIMQLTNENLLAFITTWFGTSEPRIKQLNEDLREYAVQEALRRMNK